MIRKANQRPKGGFRYFRTKEQILEYLKVPARRKLQWLEEIYRFNCRLARSNPIIGKIQEKFRRGEI